MKIKYIAEFYLDDEDVNKLDDISEEIWEHFKDTADSFRMSCETGIEDENGELIY